MKIIGAVIAEHSYIMLNAVNLEGLITDIGSKEGSRFQHKIYPQEHFVHVRSGLEE